MEKVSETPPLVGESPERATTVTPPPKAPIRSPETTNPIASASTKQPKTEVKPSTKQMQTTLDLEAPQRGRFDKSERTIVNGEDLDVPTYIRRGIKLTSPVRK